MVWASLVEHQRVLNSFHSRLHFISSGSFPTSRSVTEKQSNQLNWLILYDFLGINGEGFGFCAMCLFRFFEIQFVYIGCFGRRFHWDKLCDGHNGDCWRKNKEHEIGAGDWRGNFLLQPFHGGASSCHKFLLPFQW